MTAACEAVQLSWVLRRALGLLNTLEVCCEGYEHVPQNKCTARWSVQKLYHA